jgi:hypothetical protein
LAPGGCQELGQGGEQGAWAASHFLRVCWKRSTFALGLGVGQVTPASRRCGALTRFLALMARTGSPRR